MSGIIRVSATILTFFICHFACALETDTMICRNGIVSKGDAMPVVIYKCGPPSFADRYQEGGVVDDAVMTNTVDDWIYNFGPNEFMYGIRFENGRVKKIESLDYGY